MSAEDENEAGRGGDDLVAAEYVLGVLPADERSAVASRVDADRDFAAVVDRWEGHFAPMAAAYEAIEPPAAVKPSIDRRLFPAGHAAAEARQGGFWSSLAFWRGLTAAALAALVIAVALPFLNPPAPVARSMLVASLAGEKSDVRYMVVYDEAAGDVAFSHVSGERGAGHDFELWAIEGKNPPVSMGVIPVGSTTHIAVPPAMRQKLAAGIAVAISLEPAGGSPTGQPTGPVVAAGKLTTL